MAKRRKRPRREYPLGRWGEKAGILVEALRRTREIEAAAREGGIEAIGRAEDAAEEGLPWSGPGWFPTATDGQLRTLRRAVRDLEAVQMIVTGGGDFDPARPNRNPRTSRIRLTDEGRQAAERIAAGEPCAEVLGHVSRSVKNF